MARKRKTLESWISDRIDDPDRAPAKLSALVLFHVQGAAGRVEVHTVKIGRFSVVNAKEIADTIEGIADAFGQDLQGIQHFEVHGYYGDSTSNPARFPMSRRPNPEESGFNQSEPPNKEGQIMQDMRWKEALLTQVYRRQEAMDQTAIRREEIMGMTVARLQNEVNECYSIMRDMFMAKRKEDHDMHMAEMTFERDTLERKKLMSLAPAVVNTVFGREIIPQSTADTALLESIADALEKGTDADMAKVQQLASALPPILQMTLFARLTEIQKKKNDERDEVRALAQAQARKDIDSDDKDAAGELPPPADLEEARKKKKGG